MLGLQFLHLLSGGGQLVGQLSGCSGQGVMLVLPSAGLLLHGARCMGFGGVLHQVPLDGQRLGVGLGPFAAARVLCPACRGARAGGRGGCRAVHKR